MFFKCVIFAFLATSALARTTATSQNSIHDDETARSDDSTSYMGDLRYMYKVYQDCASSDLSTCLKLKLVTAMDRASRAYPQVTLFDGVSFIKEPTASPEQPTKSEAEIEAALPRSINEKDEVLNSMIASKVSDFFDTHTLQVKLPTASELQRSFSGEARKKKKGGGLLLIPLILGGTLIPLALGALALLAGKALIVSKLALVLAGIIGLKKLLSSGSHGGHESGHEVVVSGGHGGAGWGRSIDSQTLAYSAYAPKPSR